MTNYDKQNRFFNTDFVRENLKEKSVRGGIITLSSQAIEFLFRIGSTAILARILMPEHFGLIGMVTAITALAQVAKDFGLSTATVQQKDITHEQVSKLFWINAISGLVIMVVVSLCSFLIVRFFHDERLLYITIAISSGFFWSGLTIQHQALLQRRMKFAAIGFIQIGATVISTIISVILGLKGYGYWALVWREVLGSLMIAIGTWICCPWIPGLPKKNVKIVKLMRFGRDVAGFNVIVWLTANLDQILIGKFYGPAQVGIFRQAYNLIFAPVMQLVNPVNRVAQPALSVLQDERERYRKYYMKILTTLNFVTMPLILFLIAYSREVILVVLGERWIEATDIFRILAISVFIRPASDSTGFLLVTCGQTKRYFHLGVATGLILVVSFGVGVFWGALGVAYGHLVATCLLLVVRLRYSFEGTPVDARTFFKAIEKPLMASSAMLLVLVAMNKLVVVNNSLLLLAISLPASVVAYLAAWVMIPGGETELREIIHDVITPLRLGKYIAAVKALRN